MTLTELEKKQTSRLYINAGHSLFLSVIAFICIFGCNLTNYYSKTETVLNRPIGNEIAIEIETKEFEIPRDWVVTGYCHCEKCCGIWASQQGAVIRGASGNELISGYSCASSLPFNTIVEITFADGHKENRRVDDRGTSGNHIDLYYDTHEGALSVGCQMVSVRIIGG